MTESPVPVVLVHGWNSHPGVWNRLVPRPEVVLIPFSRSSHGEMAGERPCRVSRGSPGPYVALPERDRIDGSADLICHSVGNCITRYFLELMDNTAHQEHVRQLIGPGHPKTGLRWLSCSLIRNTGQPSSTASRAFLSRKGLVAVGI